MTDQDTSKMQSNVYFDSQQKKENSKNALESENKKLHLENEILKV